MTSQQLLLIGGKQARWLDETSTLLLFSRYAVAGLLLITIAFDLLFRALMKVGRSVSGFDELADEDELKAAKRKARRATKREDEAVDGSPNDKVPCRPRRVFLLVSLVITALTFVVDAAALIAYGMIARGGHIDEVLVYPALVSIGVYWIASLLLILDKRAEATWTTVIAILTGLSTTAQPFLLAMSIRVTVQSGYDWIQLSSAITDAIRMLLFLTLAAAYLPKLQEAIPNEASSTEEENALLTDGTAASAGDELIEGEDEAAREAAEKEEREKNKSYGPLAVLARVRRLFPYIVPLRSRKIAFLLAICLALVLLNSAVALLEPRQMGKIVDDLSTGQPPWRNIIIWAVLQIFVGWAGVFSVAQDMLWQPIQQRADRELSIMSFSHVLSLSTRFHQDKRTGEVLNVLNRSDAVSDFLNMILFEFGPAAIDFGALVLYVTAVWGTSISFVLAVTAAAYMIAEVWTRRVKIGIRRTVNTASDNLSALKNESIANVDIVKYFSAEQYEIDRFRRSTLKHLETQYTSSCYTRAVDMVQDVTVTIGILFSYLLVARQIARGEKNIGSFVAFTSYGYRLLSKVRHLSWMGSWYARVMTNTDKLMDILDEETDLKDTPDAEELYSLIGEIEFDNVSFVYPTKEMTKQEPRKALRNVSFKVKPGQHIALVGETGSGKSTIFRLLFRFFDATEGSIKVDGKDIRHVTQSSLRRLLGVVQQEASLFNDTILANIKYGDVAAEDHKVVEAAKAAQMHKRILEWPKKYHTVVGERGVKLSGGEKQRVSIARTILKNPDVLLLDEATSALDTTTEKEVQAQLRKLTQGKTTIAIAHRLSTISYSDVILVLNKGEIVESGNHAELLKIPDGHYKKLWEAQISTGVPVSESESNIATT